MLNRLRSTNAPPYDADPSTQLGLDHVELRLELPGDLLPQTAPGRASDIESMTPHEAKAVDPDESGHDVDIAARHDRHRRHRRQAAYRQAHPVRERRQLRSRDDRCQCAIVVKKDRSTRSCRGHPSVHMLSVERRRQGERRGHDGDGESRLAESATAPSGGGLMKAPRRGLR